MARRKDSAGYGTTLPATTARLVELAAEIMGDPDPDELAFIHSALAHASGRGLDRRSVLDDLERFLVRALVVRRPDPPSKENS